ncbi:NADAR family protein [Lacrimispora sp.]|uniref:NADAR family protein n=1 Tax=Lacrimispora sp. TaxID=2719234 RepID=UPI0028AAE684|nr:NADAR family protein [Lacrimispora sp.]
MHIKKGNKIMPPPWLAYPKIERYSIGWRMGYGEDYMIRFSTWWDTLSQEERTEYQTLFPEPVTWKGWWEDDDTNQVLTHEEFNIPLWQQLGVPKYTLTQLQQKVANGKRHDLCLFWGHQPSKDGSITKSCFSQWWIEEFCSLAQNYCCMEQFMMEQKAKLFGDKEIGQQIIEIQNPNQIKTLGRKVRGFDQALWDKTKYSIVLNGNWCKFYQNRALRDFLLSTGDSVLVEASPYDAIWGIRLSADSSDAQNPLKWRGQNLLGFALMEVRDELRRITQNESLCDWSMLDQ